jgi:hypothetical protein
MENQTSPVSRFSRIKLILLFGAALLVVSFIIGLILAPGIIKNHINKNGKELAGRMVHIDQLRYNYFTSTLKINGFKYFEKNDEEVFFALDTFMVNMKPLKLLRDEIYIQQLQLINPTGNFIQNDTVFNFDDLITFFTGTDSTTTEPESSTEYKLNLNNLEMKNGSVYYTDMEVNHTFKIEEVSFVIPQILWSRLDNSKADIAFKLADGGSFEGSLDHNMETGAYSGFMHIEKMAVRTILPYIQQDIKITRLDGNMSGLARFSGSVDDIYALTVSGNFEVDSLGVFDEKDRKVMGLTNVKVVFSPSEVMKNEYLFDTVSLFNPYLYLALEDSLFNFEKMMVESSEDTLTTQPVNESGAEEIPMNVVLNRFIINDGLMDFSDQTMREVFNYELSKITVDMDTFSLQDDWVNINANMKLNKRGTLEARLGVNPNDPFQRIELDYVLTDFQLPDINIYSKHYAGFPILFGDMYYVNKTKIINRQLESNNQLIIRNVEMGRKTGGLYDVPIKLALFILKDINGDIILDIPVMGDLSDPKVKIGAIVWDTFKSFMFKIVASPFKALGSLLGANSEELEEITFNYGDTTLLAKQIRSLDLLLDLEKKKPELLTELHYLNDKKLERTDAASELANHFFFRKYGKNAKSNHREYMQFLKEETGKDSLVMQDYEMLIAPVAIVDSIIQQREKLRLDLTKNYLSAKNDSTTIRIFEYNSDEVLNIGSRPRFEVRYILKEDAEE